MSRHSLSGANETEPHPHPREFLSTESGARQREAEWADALEVEVWQSVEIDGWAGGPPARHLLGLEVVDEVAGVEQDVAALKSAT